MKTLTRESEYIDWLQAWVDGYSVKEVADLKNVTLPMVYNAFRDLRREYGASDSVQLVGILFRKSVLK